MTTNVSVEQRVTVFVNNLVSVETTEAAFGSFIVHRPDLEDSNFEQSVREWLGILSEISGLSAEPSTIVSHQEVALKVFVQTMSHQKNEYLLKKMIKHLERAVAEKAIPARQVCDVVLSPDYLRAEKEIFWIEAFDLVRRIVGGVDYKGVREIMKICIDKFMNVSTISDGVVITTVTQSQMESMKSLLSHIFDRDAALLPGYFVVNEILKSYPENPTWPHWTLVPLVSDFLNSFRPTAQMVTSVNKHSMKPIIEENGRAHFVSIWKLDPITLKFLLKGTSTYEKVLPFVKHMIKPQRELLLYILRQGNSKEFVASMFNLQKPKQDTALGSLRIESLEDEMVNLTVELMLLKPDHKNRFLLWRNLASELIFFILYQYVSFPNYIEKLKNRLTSLCKERRERQQIKQSRDELMWALLQYIGGAISKYKLSNFVENKTLLGLLYDDNEAIPVPNVEDPNCVKSFAASTIFILMQKKAVIENLRFSYILPDALKLHYDFLSKLAITGLNISKEINKNFKISVFCNTYSTSQDIIQPYFSQLCRITGALSDASATVPLPAGNSEVQALGPIEPISVEVLDTFTTHAKMGFIHQIIQQISNHISTKSTIAVSPAMVENFCRMIVYSEIESLGVKGLMNNLLNLSYKNGSYATLKMILEVFSYRLHQVQVQHRIPLIDHLQKSSVDQLSPISRNTQLYTQLYHSVESTLLRLMTGLGNSDLHPSKVLISSGSGQKYVLYGDSEELNKVLILILARCIAINGLDIHLAPWVKEIVTNIMQKTPHSWPSYTLQNFPEILQNFFKENPGPKVDKTIVKQKLEDEYKKWMSWLSLNDSERAIQYFSNPTNSYFLSITWKMLLDNGRIEPLAYKVLERIGPKQLANHLRLICDVLVVEFSKSGEKGSVNKCINSMNQLIWKYGIVPIDRFILCMALRNYEGAEAQVCFLIIQLLLLKPSEFRPRVNELVATRSPEYHLVSDSYETHLNFHRKFPEIFFNGSPSGSSSSHPPDPQNSSKVALPIYYGNVCLRFMPVFDIIIHRFLEFPLVSKSLETLIDHISHLYKFHDKPITYLYNTLHYYEKRVRDRPIIRKKLISSIAKALKDVRPEGWFLTPLFREEYLSHTSAEEMWEPPIQYYFNLIMRFARSFLDKSSFPAIDYRFHEFPNEVCHGLHVSCVEIMGLPVAPNKVAANILDVILNLSFLIPKDEIGTWINAIGLIIANLPEGYWHGLYEKLIQTLKSQPLTQWTLAEDPFTIFNFDRVWVINDMNEPRNLSLLLALTHAVFHHSGFSQIQSLPKIVESHFLPHVMNEEQLLFAFHVAAPFLQRLHSERYMRPLFELTLLFYRMLQKVDKGCQVLKHMDPICDILYHIKYQFTGDSVRQDAEKIVKELSAPLQLRLRFIKGQEASGSK